MVERTCVTALAWLKAGVSEDGGVQESRPVPVRTAGVHFAFETVIAGSEECINLQESIIELLQEARPTSWPFEQSKSWYHDQHQWQLIQIATVAPRVFERSSVVTEFLKRAVLNTKRTMERDEFVWKIRWPAMQAFLHKKDFDTDSRSEDDRRSLNISTTVSAWRSAWPNGNIEYRLPEELIRKIIVEYHALV